MTTKLAIEGGVKAVDHLGPFPTKIGKDELLEVFDLWQFTEGNMEKIKSIIEQDRDIYIATMTPSDAGSAMRN